MIQGVPHVYNEDSHTKFSRVLELPLDIVKMKHFSHLSVTMQCHEHHLIPIGIHQYANSRFSLVNDVKSMKNVKNVKRFTSGVITYIPPMFFFLYQMERAYPTERIVFTMYKHWNKLYEYTEVICGEIK